MALLLPLTMERGSGCGGSGFFANRIRNAPRKVNAAKKLNGTKYDPVVSNMYPANSGAPIIMKFDGSCDIPIIVAKDFRPKYSPRIENSSGIRPPKATPNSAANRNAPATFVVTAITSSAMACRLRKKKISGGFGNLSPR